MKETQSTSDRGPEISPRLPTKLAAAAFSDFQGTEQMLGTGMYFLDFVTSPHSPPPPAVTAAMICIHLK